MVKLDDLRITKLKCLSCGSRDKRISILSAGPMSEKIGFATTCCNCGHTKKYLFRKQRKNPISTKALIALLEGRIKVKEVFCAIPEPFCPRKNCELYHRRVNKHDLRYKDIMNGTYKADSFSRSGEIKDMRDIERKRFF